MDFEAICQGLGLALAAGLLIGAVVPPVMPPWGAIAGAAPLGIIAFAASLNADDEPLWPAFPLGLVAAGLAAAVARDVTAGAARRAQGGEAAQPPAGVSAIVVLAAIAVAAASVFVPPVSLVVLAALVWLWFARRRQAERKHEGLRVLR